MGWMGVKLLLWLKSFYTPLPSPAIVLAQTDTENDFSCVASLFPSVLLLG